MNYSDATIERAVIFIKEEYAKLEMESSKLCAEDEKLPRSIHTGRRSDITSIQSQLRDAVDVLTEDAMFKKRTKIRELESELRKLESELDKKDRFQDFLFKKLEPVGSPSKPIQS